MDQQENINFSDFEQFLAICYKKCPIHNRLITHLRLDDKEDPQVIKCYKCMEQNKQQRFVDIIDLIQCDNDLIFQKWPIHDDDKISENLEKIRKWQFFQYFDEINLIFDDIIEKIQSKRKEMLKDLEQIQENQQKSLNYYQQICQKEKLADIIKNQFRDQKKQNEMILNIIKENEQNYESNKKQLLDLIKEANKHLFDLNKIKNIKEGVLSLINNFNIFANQQDKEKVEQPGIISIEDSDQNLEEIKINVFRDLYKCYNFKKINIDFTDNILNADAIQMIQATFLKCENITELTLDLSGTQLNDRGVQIITRELAKQKNIKILNAKFQENKITSTGAEYFGDLLTNLPNLQILKLFLSKNEIGIQGASKIIKDLVNNQIIQELELDLQYNSIYDLDRKQKLRNKFNEKKKKCNLTKFQFLI
ncbi:hypothetical protein ABPG73_006703 [Tetrahymena malaccensis]